MASFSERELFETVPVPRAVATLAIPTVISQVVTMIYNLADTFFVGQLGDPYMVAAVSLVSPWFNLLTAPRACLKNGNMPNRRVFCPLDGAIFP